MARALTQLVLVVCLAACSAPPAGRTGDGPTTNMGLRYMRAGDDHGFAKALAPRPLVFPADHADHPAFRTEWWYFTGTLEAADGGAYGFELTFFRVALAPDGDSRPSAWGTEQVWMAHLAITDSPGRRFVARERIARQALGLSGVSAAPLQVRVENWTATMTAENGRERWELAANDGDVALELRLETSAAPVLNGDRGLDRKGPEPGNASYYYSQPRMSADGSLMVDGKDLAVHGAAWMDREWSTSALGPDTAGWDWFGLRLSDGGSLMYYRLRRKDGTADRFSSGTLVDGAGVRTQLGPDDVELAPVDDWTSPVSGTRYPVAWRLRVPSAGISLEIQPYLADQELNVSVRYWEGAVRGRGAGPGGSLTAEGYLELAGY
jgi:predicted secreted hydrolase